MRQAGATWLMITVLWCWGTVFFGVLCLGGNAINYRVWVNPDTPGRTYGFVLDNVLLLGSVVTEAWVGLESHRALRRSVLQPAYLDQS